MCFPREKDGFGDGFWDLVSLAKDGKKGENNLGVKIHSKIHDLTRPQLGPFFVLKFVRSQGEIFSTVAKVLSDRKAMFKHKNGR